MTIAKFLRTSIQKNIGKRLLLEHINILNRQLYAYKNSSLEFAKDNKSMGTNVRKPVMLTKDTQPGALFPLT